MHRINALPTTDRRLGRARLALSAGLLAAAAAAGPVATADAMVVTTGPEGLVLREPNNTLNRVSLSLVDVAGTTKYRVEMPQFGGRGLSGGPGCTQEEPTPGLDVVTCDRTTPKVTVGLGPFDDSFTVDPSFPDPIDAFGGIGADQITLGAGDDVLRPSSGGGTVDGGAGNDVLNGGSDGGTILGGAGDDQLSADQGTSIDGGPGNDVLTVAGDGVHLVRGGDGVDTFTGTGSARVVDSRDGVPEEVFCGRFARNFESKFSLRFSRAFVDLVDTPADLRAAGCANVDRAPAAERLSVELAAKTVRLTGGKASVKVRCLTAERCKGALSVKVDGRSARSTYAIGGGRTTTLRVGLRTQGKTARVVLSEQGVRGLRTIDAILATKR